MKLKICVTGGSGFIGTNLISFFEKNYEASIYNIDINSPKLIEQNIYWKKLDIRDFKKLNAYLCEINPDYIVHLAARTDLNEKKDLNKYDTNILGVKNVLTIANSLDNLKRIIVASSMLVNKVGYKPTNNDDYNPDTLYGESKKQTESITKLYNIDWVIVRPTSIWGPWFSEPYLNFFMFIYKKIYFSVPSNISSIKTYGYVENTCYQIIKILFADQACVRHKIFYLGDYDPLNITDWADSISLELHGKKVLKIQNKLFYLMCFFGEFIKIVGFRNFPLGLFRYKNMTTNNIIDLTNTKNIAKDLPYPDIKIQIKKTLNWLLTSNKFNKN